MEDKITLAYGSGCRATRKLIQELIIKYLGNPELSKLNDSALLSLESDKIAFTTDCYTVTPIFFPGSDMGKLSIYGTVNDLAVMGAEPLYISLGLVIEEGLPMEELERIVLSIKEGGERAGIKIVCGDIKVVEKGKCDKLFITTSGIGIRKYYEVGKEKIESNDKIILNGSIGEHEISILLARGEFKFRAKIESDSQPLWDVIEKLLQKCTQIKFMRDATRGGIGVVLNEVVSETDLGIEAYEERIPVRNEVKAISEILGYEPLFLANEGKFILIIGESEAERALTILRESGFHYASIIGRVVSEHKNKVVLNTIRGGKRILDYPYGTQFPRIC